MEGSTDILNILENEEFKLLSNTFRETFECFIASKNSEVDDYKKKYDHLLVNSEQKYFEVEKQLISSNNKLESALASNSELQRKLSELEVKFTEANNRLKELEKIKEESETSQIQLTKQKDELEYDKKELILLLDKRNAEIDRLNEECKLLSERALSANSEKCAALAKLAEYQSQQSAREYQEKRLQKDKEYLQQQLDRVNDELREKTNTLINFKKERAGQFLELQSKLEELTDEIKHKDRTIEALRKEKDDLTQRIEVYLKKLKAAYDAQTESDEQFRQELSARVKLVDLYKSSAEERDGKVKELTTAVEEMQKLLKEATSAYKTLEEEKKMQEENVQELIKLKDEQIEKLNKELKHANELLSALKGKSVTLSESTVENLFPTAATTSKILKSGMSLTQIYSEYVQACDSLELEKLENKRLNQYLDQILQEIEERTPMLKKQREDYENSLATINQLTSQLDAAMLETEKIQAECDEYRRKSSHLQRECSKYQQKTLDLSQQVRYLLKEIQELRGGPLHVVADGSSTEVSSSSNIITEKLVTFGNIDELQEQNVRLLEVVRELSENKEEEERLATEEKTKELKEQLNETMKELQELQEARSRQAEMVESIVRQRDMYRVLLQQGGSFSQQMSEIPLYASTPVAPGRQSQAETPVISGGDLQKTLQETKAALKQLQAEYTTYKKERGTNERMISDELDKTKAELSEIKVQNAKLLSQLEFQNDRFKTLQSNTDGYKREITALQEKCQKYSISVVKHEEAVNVLREDLMAANEKNSRLDVQCENLRSEIEKLRMSEQHLKQEIANLHREKQSQSMLMSSLQAIQNNLERADFENKTRLKNQIDAKEKELISLRRRVESLMEGEKEAALKWEKKLSELESKLQEEQTKNQQVNNLLAECNTEIERLKEELKTSEAKCAALEEKLMRLGAVGQGDAGIVNAEEIKELKSELSQAQQQIKNLEQQLASAKKHADQYKKIADSVEETLQEQNLASKHFQEGLEKKGREMKQEIERLEKIIELIEKEKQDLLNENIKISEESHALNADLRKELSSLQNELQEAIERREMAIANEQSAKRDLDAQIKIAAEAQDKYERELMLHAADVEALTTCKKQVENFNEVLTEAQNVAKKAEQELIESRTSWLEQERIMHEECRMMDQRVRELTQQNNMLHQQMEKLTGQVVKIQQKVHEDAPKEGQSEDIVKNSDQLLEVIKFLKKEKEISETQLEVAKAECSRVNQRCSLLQQQLDDANKTLSEERQTSQIAVQAAAQHADMMKKVQNLNLLTDSNKLLREERDKLQKQLHEAEAKVRKLEEDIAPHQANVRSLTAQRDALLTEKNSLISEVDRWKSRTNHLIEQSHKADPEEHKRVMQEKENMRRQITQANEDRTKLRAEITKLNANIQSSQNDLQAARNQITQLNVEITNLKTQLEVSNQDTEEKVKTINQLKKIGRKYKEQTETLNKSMEDQKKELENKQKEFEELKNKSASQEANQPNMAALEQTTAELRGKMSTVEKERDELQQKVRQKESDMTEIKEELDRTKREIGELQESSKKLKEENAEYEKKQAHSRAVLQTAKNKLTNQRQQLELLTSKNEELKKKVASSDAAQKEESEMRFNSMKSQFESRIARLEKDLQEARTSSNLPDTSDYQQQLEAKQKEIHELQTRMNLLQKTLENQQKAQAQTPSIVGRPAATAQPSIVTAETPKKANIRPMATAVTSVRPTTPISHSSAAAKVTASIRPMAIASTSAPQASTSTPTATVMPTTVTQQEAGDDLLSSSSSAPQTSTGGIPSASVIAWPQQVQRVSPQVESIQGSESDLLEETSHVTEQSSQQTLQQTVQPVPSTSSHIATAETSGVVQTSKRPRDENEGQEDQETQAKRTRIGQDHSPIPKITLTDENSHTVSLESPHSQDKPAVVAPQPVQPMPQETSTSQAETITVAPLSTDITTASDSGAKSTEQIQASESVTSSISQTQMSVIQQRRTEESKGDVIFVPSDEEEGNNMNQMQAFEGNAPEYAESDEQMDEEDEDDEDDEDDDDDDDEDYEDDDEEKTGGDEHDDDVVIIDVDENDQQMTSQNIAEGSSESHQVTSQQSATGSNPPAPLQSMNQTAAGRAQLTPFLLGSQPGPFEEEDCTVPSTPTLSLPRRGDGFAEALNSPQVPQSFVFGSGVEGLSQPELAQLESQRALGMDDTRMDLSQFDDGGGRNVPSMPVSAAAPATTSAESVAQQSESSVSVSKQEETGTETEQSAPTEKVPETSQEREEIEEAALLGGQGDKEEMSASEETGEVTSGDAPSEGVTQKGDEAGGDMSEGDDKTQSQDSTGMARPRIQRITWSATEASGSAPTQQAAPQATAPVASTAQTVPPSRQVRGLRRGATPTRSRGAQWRGPRRAVGRPSRGHYRHPF